MARVRGDRAQRIVGERAGVSEARAIFASRFETADSEPSGAEDVEFDIDAGLISAFWKLGIRGLNGFHHFAGLDHFDFGKGRRAVSGAKEAVLLDAGVLNKLVAWLLAFELRF